MIRLIKWLLITSFVLGAVLGIVVYGLVENEPLVDPVDKLTATEQQHIDELLRSRLPLDKPYGKLVSLNLSEIELNLIIKFFEKSQEYLPISSNWLLLDGITQGQMTITLPENPVGKYLNISVRLHSDENDELELRARNLKMGYIPLPDGISQSLVKIVHVKLLENVHIYRSAVGSIGRMKISTGQLNLHYRWNRKLANDLQNHFQMQMMSGELQQGVNSMLEFINKQQSGLSDKIRLDEMLRQLFRHAHEELHELPPEIENRSIFISLAALIMDYDLPGIKTNLLNQQRKLKLSLYGRYDLAKHFVLSAAVTSLSNPVLAEVIGMKKEIADSYRGSGFSFADLAADRAGIKLAVESEARAIDIQKRMMAIKSEVDFMPTIEQLPEGILSTSKKSGDDLHNEQVEKYNRIIAQRIENLRVYN